MYQALGSTSSMVEAAERLNSKHVEKEEMGTWGGRGGEER